MATQPPENPDQNYFLATTGMDFTSEVNPELLRQAADMSQRSKFGLLTTVPGVAISAVPDLVDTAVSSIPFSPFERGELNQTALDAIGMPGLNRFYNERQGAIEATSGMYGIIATEIGLGKALKAARPFLSAMKTNPIASRILAADRSYAKALVEVRRVDAKINATAGGLNAHQYLKTLESLGIKSELGATRATLANRARRIGTARSVARAGLSEVAYATWLNENDFLYDDDMANNLMMAGIGLGIAGVTGTIWTNYAMRKFNTSEAQQRLVAGAFDPTALERARIGSESLSKMGPQNPDLSLKGGWMDEAVSYLVDAGAKQGPGVDLSLAGSLAVEKQSKAADLLNKVTIRGIPGTFGTGFSGAEKPYWRALMDYALRDPSGLIGTEHIGGVGRQGETSASIIEKFFGHLDKRESEILDTLQDPQQLSKLNRKEIDGLGKELNQIRYNKTFSPLVMVDRELVTPAVGKVFDEWVEPVVKRTGGENQVRFWAESADGSKRGIEMDTDLSIYIDKPGLRNKIPTAKSLAKLTMPEIGTLFRVGRDIVREFRKTGNKMILPKKPTWFHIDLAEELIKLADDPSVVQWPAGMTRETAQVEAFAQKAEILQSMEKQVADGLDADMLHLMRFKLNLPRLSAYEASLLGGPDSGLDILLRGTYANGNEIRKLPLNALLQSLEDGRRLNDLAELEAYKPSDLRGNAFNFLTESTTSGVAAQPNPVSPLVVFKRPLNDNSWLKANLAEQLAVRKASRIGKLIDAESSPMIRQLAGSAIQSADLRLAMNSSGLSDLQLQAALPGMGNLAPSSGIRRIADGVLTTEMRVRDQPVILAGQRLRSQMDQLSQHNMTQAFEAAFGDKLNQIASPRNQASNLMVQHWLSHAGGWELEKKVTKKAIPGSRGADGKPIEGYVWMMKATEANRSRWKLQFGDAIPFPKDRTMVDNRGNPIYVDQLAFDVIQGLDRLGQAKLANDNTLRRAVGLGDANAKPWWVPPPDVEGKHIAYAIDQLGRIVPTGAIIADSEEALDAAIQRAYQDPTHVANREGVAVKRLKDIRSRANLLDRVQMEMTNPGWMPVVGRYKGEGKNAKAYTDLASLETTLGTYRNHFLRQGREVLYVLTKESQDAARARSKVMTPMADDLRDPTSGKTIHDIYLEVMTGQSGINTSKSWWGAVQRPIANAYEAIVPKVVNGVTQLVKQPMSAAASKAHAMLPEYLKEANFYRLTASEKQKWEEMRDGLGEAMPFKTIAEYLEAKKLAVIPPDMRQHMAGLQSFTATWILRMWEGMQALMNMAGTVNAMPAVAKHMRLLPGESEAARAQRIGHIASIFQTPNGANISTLNMAKLMYQGFKRAWNRTSEASYKRLAGKGMLSQSVSELQVAFNNTSLANKSARDLFLNGDPRSSNRFMKKGLVGWISILSDESEHLSRSWAHFTGEELGKALGIPAGDTLDNFAHDFANKTIANYSPLNRAEAFQGPLGAPIALFQSFMVAYYQRLFRYLETGDFGALATQYAWQTGVFGLQTVPGYSELNQFLIDRGEDELPYDKAVRDFGPETGDLLMSGVIGNLPKIFFLGDGIDLSARGGTEMRLPVIAQAPAVVTTARKIFNGVGESIDMLMNQGIDGRRVAEILSNTLPNRPMSGLIEVAFLDGQDVDTNGRIATENKNAMDATARILGARTISQAAELNAFYTNKAAQEVQASKQESLRKQTRAAIRGGAKPEDLQSIFDEYVSNGGDPRNYRRWLKSQFDDALTTRGEKQLKETLRNPKMQAQAQRLLDAYVTLDEEEGYEASPLPPPTWEDMQ